MHEKLTKLSMVGFGYCDSTGNWLLAITMGFTLLILSLLV